MAERRFSKRLQVAQNPLRTILDRTELKQSRAYFNQLNQLLITHTGPGKRQRSGEHDSSEPVHKRQRPQRPLYCDRHNSTLQFKGTRRQNKKHRTSLLPQQALVGDQSPHSQRDQSRKRKRGSSPDDARKRPKPLSPISNSDTDLIAYWAESGRWPQKYPESENNMGFPLAQKKSSSSLRRKTSESGASTPSDQGPREEKSAPYKNSRYKTVLETKGSFMEESDAGIAEESKALCQTLLASEQALPLDTLFRDDILRKTCRKLEDRNETRVIRDIAQLIVPSAEVWPPLVPLIWKY